MGLDSFFAQTALSICFQTSFNSFPADRYVCCWYPFTKESCRQVKLIQPETLILFLELCLSGACMDSRTSYDIFLTDRKHFAMDVIWSCQKGWERVNLLNPVKIRHVSSLLKEIHPNWCQSSGAMKTKHTCTQYHFTNCLHETDSDCLWWLINFLLFKRHSVYAQT